MLALAISSCGGAPDVEEVVVTPAGNEIRFAVTEFTVTAGQPVRLVFNNTANTPAMQHNVVVLRDREAIDRVGMAALQVGAELDYVPRDEAIIANTALAEPGKTVEVIFSAPAEPGDYPYICSFPGHYSLMQGTMHVVE